MGKQPVRGSALVAGILRGLRLLPPVLFGARRRILRRPLSEVAPLQQLAFEWTALHEACGAILRRYHRPVGVGSSSRVPHLRPYVSRPRSFRRRNRSHRPLFDGAPVGRTVRGSQDPWPHLTRWRSRRRSTGCSSGQRPDPRSCESRARSGSDRAVRRVYLRSGGGRSVGGSRRRRWARPGSVLSAE